MPSIAFLTWAVLPSSVVISSHEIRITYKLRLDSIFSSQQQQKDAEAKVTNTRRKRKSIALPDQSLVHVNLRFKDVGGRIEEVTVTSSEGEQYDMPEASMARLRALQKANDVPLIVQEVLAAF